MNCLWDLAPHDLSIIDNLFPSDVISIEATGYGHTMRRGPTWYSDPAFLWIIAWPIST